MAGVLQKLAEKFAVQTAVYWGSPKPDGYGGYSFSEPEEIKVRWDGEEEISIDQYGNEFYQKAKVIVTKDLDFEGYMLLGKLIDLPSDTTSPVGIPEAYQIRRKVTVPMVKKTDDFFRTVYLGTRI